MISKLMSRALRAASLSLFILAGLGCQARRVQAPGGSGVPAPLDLPSLTRSTLGKGARMPFERKFGRNLALSFGIPVEGMTAFEIAEAHVTEDHRQRAFALLLDPEGGSAASIMLMAVEWSLPTGDKGDLYLHLTPGGDLRLGLHCRGKIDEYGAYVKGTCVLQRLDPDAEETKTLLQREMDFWLKGIGRKARPPKPPIEAIIRQPKP
ncbi:MAG: hypothetical protein HY748_03510 [Elusimicrobia bacterium]|nr:hypothetical protein [Elusimicrobiota bacterium]